MNNHTKIYKTIIFCTLSFSILFAVSCRKDIEHISTNSILSPKSAPVPHFNSWDDVFGAAQKARAIDSLPGIVEYENLQGRISWGRIMDSLFESIEVEDFEDEDQMYQYINSNPQLFDVINLDGGGTAILPKWHNHPFRYVSNIDGIFTVNTTGIKIFQQGVVYTDITNLDYLYELTESDLNSIDTSSILFYTSFYIGWAEPYVVHPQCDYTTLLRTHSTNGDNQIVLKIQTERLDIPDPDHPHDPSPTCSFTTDVIILNLHRYFNSDNCWWTKRRRTNCQGNVKVHTKDSSTTTWTTFQKTITISNIKIGMKTIPVYTSDIESTYAAPANYLHLYSYDITAWATSTGSATLYHSNS